MKIKERERVYELNYVLVPSVEEEKIKEIETRIKESIISQNGEILSIENLGKKKLAYKILNYREGIYFLITARTKNSVLKSIQEFLKIREDVLRFLIVRKEN